MQKANILILSFTDHARDPRVYRQMLALQDDYDVVSAGTSKSSIAICKHIALQPHRAKFSEKVHNLFLLKMGFYEKYYWKNPCVIDAFNKLKEKKFELIIANDLETLPLVLRLAQERKGTKVWLDAHEYEPKHYDDLITFRIFLAPYWDYICRTYLPKVQYMTTVCEGIAQEYQNNYGVDCQVLFNAPPLENLVPSAVTPDRIKMVHHGGITKSRRIENMIKLMEHLDERFSLDLMLLSNDFTYMTFLRKIAKSYPRVKFIEPVEMPEIAKRINEYDMGLYMLPPVNFNNKLALPNKFFEFLQARLAVAIWPSPEMKRIVDKEGVGIVADTFSIESMASRLNELSSERLQKLKSKTTDVAKRYNSAIEEDKIRQIVKRCMET